MKKKQYSSTEHILEISENDIRKFMLQKLRGFKVPKNASFEVPDTLYQNGAESIKDAPLVLIRWSTSKEK